MPPAVVPVHEADDRDRESGIEASRYAHVARDESRHRDDVSRVLGCPAGAPTLRGSRESALYARVSTLDQQPENQLAELRRYVAARGWTAVEYVDPGVSGAKDRRPALDRLVKDAGRRKFDVLVTWKLDRLGRNLKHLITLLEHLQVLGVAFISLGEGIDATTPAGKLQMHILGAIAEFERGRIVERVRAGLARAKAQETTLGRRAVRLTDRQLATVATLSVREAARQLGVSVNTYQKARRLYQQTSPAGSQNLAQIAAA